MYSTCTVHVVSGTVRIVLQLKYSSIFSHSSNHIQSTCTCTCISQLRILYTRNIANFRSACKPF